MITKDQINKRAEILSAIGLRYNGEEYCKEDYNVHWTEIVCDTDEEFEAKVNKIKAEMQRRKDAQS